MTHERRTGRGTWRRMARLPRRARACGLVMLAAAMLPAAAAIVGAVSRGDATRHTGMLDLAAACVALAAVIALAPPCSASPLAYARQLRAWFLELQFAFDADERLRPGEGKEKEDGRSPSKP